MVRSYFSYNFLIDLLYGAFKVIKTWIRWSSLNQILYIISS